MPTDTMFPGALFELGSPAEYWLVISVTASPDVSYLAIGGGRIARLYEDSGELCPEAGGPWERFRVISR